MIVRNLIAAALLCLLLASCEDNEPVVEQTSGATASTPAPVVVTKFSLYTHCGIHELRHEGKWYVRDGGRLDDGASNPPPGWTNPTQVGTLSLRGNSATFTDDSGHRESFTLRPGADEPLALCM